MGMKKKEIRIIKNDSNKEDYTFVRDNILNNTKKAEIIELKKEPEVNKEKIEGNQDNKK